MIEFAPPSFVRVLAGWPFLSFQGGTDGEHVVSAVDVASIAAGISGPLPYGPLWPGFALNTLFYAAILWLLIRGSFVLRRSSRVRRGLCGACGYDLRGASHSACPECGANVRPVPCRVAAAASRLGF
jgi:hypothetical protein